MKGALTVALAVIVGATGCSGDGEVDLTAYCAQIDELRRIDQQLFDIEPTNDRATNQGFDRFQRDLDEAARLAPDDIDDDLDVLAAWVAALGAARELPVDDPDDLEALGAYSRAIDELPDIAPQVARIRSHARRACGIEL